MILLMIMGTVWAAIDWCAVCSHVGVWHQGRSEPSSGATGETLGQIVELKMVWEWFLCSGVGEDYVFDCSDENVD